MLIYANADIFSCAIIAALYGTLIKFMMNVKRERCSTQLAAIILSCGITILLLRNHKPITSASIVTIKPNTIWIVTADEKFFLILLDFLYLIHK